jgi:transcription initiation factor TFIID subunit 2
MFDEYTTYPLGELIEFFKRLKDHKSAFLFKQNIEEIVDTVPTYSEIIKKPIDLNKIEAKIMDSKYHTLEEFRDDMVLMLNNCKT